MIADCGPGREALATVESLRTDIVLISLPDRDAFAVCREIRERLPMTRVVAMSYRDGEEDMLNSVLAGASGYLVRDARGPELARAIRTAASIPVSGP